MADRKIRENEVPRRGGPIQVDHTGDWGTSQDWWRTPFRAHTSMCERSRLLQGRKEKVIGVHGE